MPLVNDPDLIKAQYRNGDKLDIRIRLHQKYSLNKEPFGEWIHAHYHLAPGMRVLELGCGTGSMWQDAARWLPQGAELILSDFSEGMLEQAQRNVPPLPGITFRQVDIRQIPFEDDAFDVVIANMMLYHVPDLHGALAEVARVLKPEGRFFCATVGERGIARWLAEVLGCQEADRYPFSLQNGGDALRQHFGSVQLHTRQDGLRVTDQEELVEYVLSMASFSGLRQQPREQLTAQLVAQAVDGVIAIPKEYGLFEASQMLG